MKLKIKLEICVTARSQQTVFCYAERFEFFPEGSEKLLRVSKDNNCYFSKIILVRVGVELQGLGLEEKHQL
jgi:hypothetical protein